MSQSHQAATLGRHMRNALQGDAKKLYDDVWKEYRRITSDPEPNAIGMLTALLSECLIEWSHRERTGVCREDDRPDRPASLNRRSRTLGLPASGMAAPVSLAPKERP